MQGTKFLAGVWGEAPSRFGRQPNVTPFQRKRNVVSAQNAKHSAIETGSRWKSLFCSRNPILKPLLKPPRSEEGGWGIGITRPLCGIQRDGNRKSQGALARSRSGRVCRRQRTAPLCEFPGKAPSGAWGGNPIVTPVSSIAKRKKARIRKRSET